MPTDKIVPKGKRQGQSERGRLDAETWADAALAELGENGIDRVRVELLAKQLSVTKGSFYWHFRDRDALLAMMLDRWRRRATLGLIERLDRLESSPEGRIRKLLRLPLEGERSAIAATVELAIRLWGRTDPRARAALEEVDELRLRYIEQLFVECGSSPATARARAVLAYSYQRVAATLVGPEAVDLTRQCESLLLALDADPRAPAAVGAPATSPPGTP